MSKRVYILNDGGQDYSAAAEFGELVICTEGQLNKYDVASMYRQLTEVLDLSEPGDYLMVNSLATLGMVAAGIMSALHGELHLLLFDAKTGKYVSRDLNLD